MPRNRDTWRQKVLEDARQDKANFKSGFKMYILLDKLLGKMLRRRLPNIEEDLLFGNLL